MKTYNQTTRFTCAPAALAMIVNHFKPDFLLNIENEIDIWRQTVALPIRGSSIFGLAVYAHKQGIPLKVVVGEEDYKFPRYRFKSYKKTEVHIASFISEMLQKEAKERGIEIEERSFELKEVDSLLKEGKILLLRLSAGIIRKSHKNRNSPHYFPVYEFEDGKYKIMDPRKGPLEVDKQTMNEAFDKVIEMKRDPRMIVFG